MILIFAALALMALGCARTGPPPGGPRDETPPAVVETYPAPESVNVPVDVQVEVTFSERVVFGTLAKAFSLSPPPPGAVRAYPHGKRIEFHFDPPLLDDRTYVLTLGTGLTDEQNNQALESYHLAFSTGERLDRAWMDGTLKIGGDESGWTIAGYFLDADSVSDDPDPAYERPDAATQANRDGHWDLLYLKPGRWRVFAFKDQDGDRLWTPWSEKLAVPPYDIEVNEDTLFTPRSQVLVPADRPTSISPMRISSIVKNVLDVRFDRKPPSLEGEFWFTQVPDSVKEKLDATVIPEDTLIPIVRTGYKALDSSIVELVLDENPAGDALFVGIRGEFGVPGTAIDTAMAVPLSAAAEEDTFKPVLMTTLPSKEARLSVNEQLVTLLFSKPMAEIPRDGVRLVYRGVEDTSFATLGAPDPYRRTLLVNPQQGGQVQIELFGEKITDIFGNSLADSLLIVQYELLPDDSLGSVTGTVQTGGQEGELHLNLLSLSRKNHDLQIVLQHDAEFRFDRVPAGDWRIEGWIDRSGSEHGWDRGNAVPFQPSDPYHIAPDTIKVRARWESGGVTFIFP
jgi:hypothetical protein